MNLVHVLIGAAVTVLGVNLGADLNSDVLEWVAAVAAGAGTALALSNKRERV